MMLPIKLQQSKIQKLAAKFNLMLFLVINLLISNILLAALAFYNAHHQTISVIPFAGNELYNQNDNLADPRYISLMSENFIYSRLNITPETVTTNHQRLLNYVDPQNYQKILNNLYSESKLVQAKKLSSYFVITNININGLNATVSGILHRHVGIRAIKPEKITFQLGYRYKNGHLSIIKFIRLPRLEKQHA